MSLAPMTDRITRILTDLVAFDTVSHKSNLPLIAYVERYLAELGVESARILDETGQKASLFATIGPQRLYPVGPYGCGAGGGSGLDQ